MLGIIGEHTRNERARRLVDRFVNVMSELTNSIDPQEVSGPIQRGLAALYKLDNPDGRASRFGDGVGHGTHHDITAIAEDGSIKVDQGSVPTPASLDHVTKGEEHSSPYSVLNTILWGNAEGYPA